MRQVTAVVCAILLSSAALGAAPSLDEPEVTVKMVRWPYT